jgi:gluconolactonase
MKKHVICVVFVIGLAWSVGQAQAPSGSSVVRLNPALDAIISPSAKLELLFKTPGGTEGPVWVNDGQYLLFTSSERTNKGRVYKLTPSGELSLFLEPTGGGNGLALDRQGRLIVCAMDEKKLVRVEKDGTRTTLADRFEGKSIDGPNDIAVKSDGSIYFTDELSVFRWKDGKLQQLMKSTVPGGRVVNGVPGARVVNGITLSPDEKFLYVVVVPDASPRRIARYELRPDGTIIGEPRPGRTLTDERIWFPLPDQNPLPTRASGQPDGIKVDLKGNVYFGGPGGRWIVSPEGTHLGTILIPGGHSNLAFGDADGKSLYFTLGNGLARIRLNAPAI